MLPIIAVAVLIRALDAIKAFDVVYTLTGGGPGSSTETTTFYIYQAGYQFFRLGYGAAGSIVMLIFLSVLLTILLRVPAADAGLISEGEQMRRRKRSVPMTIFRGLIYFFVLAFFLFPIFWILMTSIKEASEYMHSPPIWFPAQPDMGSFAHAIDVGGLDAMRNSLIISLSRHLAVAANRLTGRLRVGSL